MDGLFLFPDAARQSVEIDQWSARQTPEPLRLRSPGTAPACLWRRCDVRDVMHDGCPTACAEDGGRSRMSRFSCAREHRILSRRSELADPARLLAGTGKRMRHVKLKPGDPVDADAVASLIGAAYSDMKKTRLAKETVRS